MSTHDQTDKTLIDSLTAHTKQLETQNELLTKQVELLSAGISPLSVQTTAATGKTPFAGLSQWTLQDKPRMEDFNADNMKVDEKLRALSENKVDKDTTGWMPLIAINGATTTSAAYRKEGNAVWLRGWFGNISEGMIICQLPEEARPTGIARGSVVPVNTNGSLSVVFLSIGTDGNITAVKAEGTSVFINAASFMI